MIHRKEKVLVLLLLVTGLTGLRAQEAISASGGNSTSSGGILSYTVGQVCYTTVSGSNGSVAQGVQQPFEVASVSTAIDEVSGISLNCTVFPNPVSENLTLSVENFNIQNLTYQLFDLEGKLLDNQPVVNTQTTVSMETYANGVYFLKVTQNGSEIKTFKILKN